MSKILGIIPARKGSKGVKNKNSLIINGKPLIEYTINSALKSKIDKILVSTNCSKIQQISILKKREVLYNIKRIKIKFLARFCKSAK